MFTARAINKKTSSKSRYVVPSFLTGTATLLLIASHLNATPGYKYDQVPVGIDENNEIIYQGQCVESPNDCCEEPAGGASGSAAGDGDTSTGCAWITISSGAMLPGAALAPGFFNIKIEHPSPEMFTPNRIHYVMGYSLYIHSKWKTSAGLPRHITAINKDGVPIVFQFADDEAVGIPLTEISNNNNHRLMMVDAEGWATDEDPAFYDLYPGDGTVFRFIAASHDRNYLGFVHFKEKTGRIETPETLQTQIIRDEMRTIRQVLAPTCLIDIVATNSLGYTLRFFQRDDVQAAPGADGLFTVNSGVEPIREWRIMNPPDGDGNQLRVIKKTGTSVEQSDFSYNPGSDTWTLVKGGGLNSRP
jgi:hypothetical protein